MTGRVAWETAMQQIKALKAENERLREACAIALEDLENTFPDEAALSDVDTRESIRALRQAIGASGKEVTEA
jgi:hypothetical protein